MTCCVIVLHYYYHGCLVFYPPPVFESVYYVNGPVINCYMPETFELSSVIFMQSKLFCIV